MAFVNEVVSDRDIDKYGLPFKKGSGRYWTRDAERDMYLWGGKGGNPAIGERIYGYFNFFLQNVKLEVVISPGEGSHAYSEAPYVIKWREIVSITPSDLYGLDKSLVVNCLKEALIAYADDGRHNQFAPCCSIVFDF